MRYRGGLWYRMVRADFSDRAVLVLPEPVEPHISTAGVIVSSPQQSPQFSERRPATETWRSTLSRTPTLFGRLVFLASLRNPKNGRYSHDALDGIPTDDADRTLRNSHQQVFQQWISSGLAEQKCDLEEYLGAVGGSWPALTYRDLIPSTAHEVERQLYLTDLETLLELLRSEGGATYMARGA